MATSNFRRYAALVIAPLAVATLWLYLPNRLPTIGAVTTVTELTSGLTFPARVDTGAEICSLHYEQLEIPSPADDPEENIGKLARIQLATADGQIAWIETPLVKHAQVRTNRHTGSRYFVQLPLRAGGVEAVVLVNLNNRTSMRRPMLLGRNFLRGRFVVDVTQDDADLETE